MFSPPGGTVTVRRYLSKGPPQLAASFISVAEAGRCRWWHRSVERTGTERIRRASLRLLPINMPSGYGGDGLGRPHDCCRAADDDFNHAVMWFAPVLDCVASPSLNKRATLRI
jgi:hypothetical protein